jgi:hypothetical protein
MRNPVEGPPDATGRAARGRPPPPDDPDGLKGPNGPLPGDDKRLVCRKNVVREDDKNLHLPVKEEEVLTVNQLPEKTLPPLNVKALTRARDKKMPAASSTAAPGGALSVRLRNALLEGGVFPALLDEVGRSGREEAELFALLGWAREERPERPAALFMARLRAGAKPPGRFFGEACTVCGQTGGHTPDCRRRYLDDPYAGLVEH